MADERVSMNVNDEQVPTSVESTDRGMFDFMKKKEDDQKPVQDEAAIASEFDHKVQVSEPEVPKEEEKKHESLLEKFHRSDSSSSSSSDEEGDDEEKKQRRKERKEKKGLKEKLKEKLPGHKDEEDTNVPIEKYHDEKPPHVQEVVYTEPSHLVPTSHVEGDQEKKGFLDKIKDKLPGKKAEEHHDSAAAPAVVAPVAAESGAEGEKKGFLEKIKDKIPGFHSKDGEQKREIDEDELKKESD